VDSGGVTGSDGNGVSTCVVVVGTPPNARCVAVLRLMRWTRSRENFFRPGVFSCWFCCCVASKGSDLGGTTGIETGAVLMVSPAAMDEDGDVIIILGGMEIGATRVVVDAGAVGVGLAMDAGAAADVFDLWYSSIARIMSNGRVRAMRASDQRSISRASFSTTLALSACFIVLHTIIKRSMCFFICLLEFSTLLAMDRVPGGYGLTTRTTPFLTLGITSYFALASSTATRTGTRTRRPRPTAAATSLVLLSLLLFIN